MDTFCSIAVIIALSKYQSGDTTCFEFNNMHLDINTNQCLMGIEKNLVCIQFFYFLRLQNPKNVQDI